MAAKRLRKLFRSIDRNHLSVMADMQSSYPIKKSVKRAVRHPHWCTVS
jgi:hypothetical protein